MSKLRPIFRDGSGHWDFIKGKLHDPEADVKREVGRTTCEEFYVDLKDAGLDEKWLMFTLFTDSILNEDGEYVPAFYRIFQIQPDTASRTKYAEIISKVPFGDCSVKYTSREKALEVMEEVISVFETWDDKVNNG